MKTLFLAPIAAIALMAATVSNVYNVDTTASKVKWRGEKVTGFHEGGIAVKKGTLTYADGKLTGGSFEIDMNSITCTDLDAETGGKLVGHLKSADFFGADKYATSKYVITKAIPIDSKGNYKIIGNLTIKETTKEVKFNAFVMEKDGKIAANGKITIDRSEYDVRFGSGAFFENLGDKTIYDEFTLEVTLAAKK
ncbi:MAG: YceI family protein [Flavobacteriales bacterium]|jgi:polyisoprenoid-binding protein YceI